MNFTDPNEDLYDLPKFETSDVYDYDDASEKKINKALKQINEEGYAILDLNHNDEIFETINKKIDKKIFDGNPKLNPKFYHYNENPRGIEAWSDIKEIAD